MAGRESEYQRGLVAGVQAMLVLITSGEVDRLDKDNIIEYANAVIKKEW